MKKKNHKFQVGQLIRVKNSFHVGEKLRKKYGFIVQQYPGGTKKEQF